MPLTRAKPPDTLYADVAPFDLVLVPDAALASALDRRLDHPHFGTFATTPRRLAAGRREQAEDRTAFLEVIERTDHDWRDVAHAVGNVLQCWEHEGSRDAIFEYDAHVTETTRDVVDVLGTLSTTSRQLTEHEIPADQSVAVVGAELLTPLERASLPAHAERIDLFTEEPFDAPPFHVFDAKTDVVDAVLDTVTPANADRVAVVLDGSSQYSSLLESALAAADVPFYGGPGFAEDPDHRAVLRLLRLGTEGADRTVEAVEPLLSQMGVEVPVAHRKKRLAAVDDPALEGVKAFIADLSTRTVGAAVAAYSERAGVDLAGLEAELVRLGLADAPVTAQAVDRLAYYLQTYEVPVDRENEGVLLADATASSYVDRPVVFFLGMDEGWTQSAPQRPWVDTEAQFDRYLGSFQQLLQSGERQYYLVQDTAGGEPVTPSLYFDELFSEAVERFTDLDAVDHRRRPQAGGEGFSHQAMDVEPEPVETISQSSLNSYVNSPRDYFFSELLEEPDQARFVEGALFHDFAEFYVDHPETVAEADIDELAELMLEEASAFVDDHDRPLKRREFRIGLQTIVAYLDENGPAGEAFLTGTTDWGENAFAAFFDEPVESPLTERWFEDPERKLKGKIDLVAGPAHLLDYKSGSKTRATTVVKRAGTDPVADVVNFQAALYLTYYRQVQPGEPIDFTFFYFLEVMDDVIAGEADIADALTTVTYYPFTFEEYVASKAAFEVLLDGYQDCQATFEDLGYATYNDIVSQLAIPETTDKAELRASSFATAFTEAVAAETSADLDVEKGVDQAIRALNTVRKQNFFREDLDAFETFVEERVAELNHRLAGAERFPVQGPGGEPNERRLDNPDLLLEGQR